MQIDVHLVPSPPGPDVLANRAVVVMDVLRATSVIVHAMQHGAKKILPVTRVEEAFSKRETLSPQATLLGGERQSWKISGFDLGNSPREYAGEVVKGKTLVLMTTNGTRAFHAVAGGRVILVGSFFNMTALARKCVALDLDLLVFLSGDQGSFSLEDGVCGGMVIDRILGMEKGSVHLTDASRATHALYQRFEMNLLEALHLSKHGRELAELGLGDDLAYCAQIDVTDLVPTFRDGVISVGP